MTGAKTIQEYFDNVKVWKEELLYLRELVLSMGLEETIKWGGPCYTYDGKNVIGLADFKTYTGLWFFQGALLKDEKQYLVSGNYNTQVQRQWRFYSMAEIKKAPIKAYIKETLIHFKAGVKVKIEKKPLIVPEALEAALKKDKALNAQWLKLSLSCKREFAEYISEAKKEETKLSRIEKIKPMIMEVKSMNEKYR
jgi:uncharacterized protein YdeI (YjbR/CyaY-like superfamily)